MVKTLRVPEATVTRLSVYSRYLERLDRNGVITVSSGEIAEGVGVSPAQVRKDLAYFGEFGTRGVGYNVKDLMRYTLKILGLDRHWNLILVGAGNLGYALCTYKGFDDRGFTIVGVFDDDLTKIGKKINELDVMPLEEIPRVIKENNVRIGIIAVPPGGAQGIADIMVANDIQAIMNFSTIALNVPDYVEVRNVDLSVKLEILTFNLGFRAAQNL
ncbi:MAG: redox-sensing transcriptional repressor rex [Peptococcaceae bacterium BRH_c4b]|nr:MAG: redox-sensing transcriptional repressor rex [Peptococcaceae bacterium BRH_c4b]